MLNPAGPRSVIGVFRNLAAPFEHSLVNRSNSRNRHPIPPPPYQQHLYQNTFSITNSPTAAYSRGGGGAQKYQYSVQHPALSTAAPPNVVFHNSANAAAAATSCPSAAVTKESNPEFFAVIKRNPDGGVGGGGGQLPRPPSDHFYFKITDGKTEFI